MPEIDERPVFRLRTVMAVALGMTLGGLLHLRAPSLFPEQIDLDTTQRLVTFFLTVSLSVLVIGRDRRLALALLGLSVGFGLHGAASFFLVR
ncbi:hypothetical protein [Deinococcus enclensis]|uniref:Uncharacterized protein n=1 Tax=Deinococcus enclensis TaxID=1049582 RepID=A0ABT9MI01_9DEIO|nr:hypothetical protein [Deinococcus enclensis]MDP9766104.1 hypothetical protein [Deinococcus enclensis]